MDLDLNAEQAMLRESLRKVLENECTPAVVRDMEDDAAGYPPRLWKTLTDMGLPGISIPESCGGMGLGALHLAVVYEEFGRALCPSPHFASSVLAAGFLGRAGEDHRRAWLPRIASGESIVVPAWLEPGGSFGASGVTLRARSDRAGFRLSGTKFCVPFAAAAQALLVPAREDSGGIGMFLVPAQTPGIELAPLRTMGGDAQYEVVFRDALVPASARAAAPETAWEAWRETLQQAQLALAAWQVGCAERAHEMAVAYAKERVQFGRPIGAFQAISHPLADSATEIAGARTLVQEAAWARDAGRAEAGRLSTMARLYADEAAQNATTTGHQTLGGIGFTRDIDMQLYYRRSKQAALSWREPECEAAVLDALCL